MLIFLKRINAPLAYLNFADFLAPLALRLYLVPVFWMAGSGKLNNMESTIAWFGNPDWGLGLPLADSVGLACHADRSRGCDFAIDWIWCPMDIYSTNGDHVGGRAYRTLAKRLAGHRYRFRPVCHRPHSGGC